MNTRLFTLGGAAWINLSNTINMRDNRIVDALEQLEHAEGWLKENGFMLDRHSGELDSASLRDDLVSLRENCMNAIHDLKQEGRLTDRTFTELENKLCELAMGVRIERQHGSIQIMHKGQTLSDQIRYEILSSMVDTLQNYSSDRIRQCEHEACILHFVDTSKSGKRRWCSMELCGNRQKASEFYARKRAHPESL